MPAQADPLRAITAVTELAMLEGYPKIDWVAAKLDRTRRTLQRELAASGTSFSAMLEDLLADRARNLLAAEQPVTEVALTLGYTDPAHFTRAFRRWTGLPPSQWRRLNRVSEYR